MSEKQILLREHWQVSTLAQKFEIAVTVILYCVIAGVAVFALARLGLALITIVTSPWNITDLQAIQLIFGMVMTVLIALEFGHSLLRNLKNHAAIIHAKEIILIGIMAIVRKLIILDLNKVSALMIMGLAAAIVALGCAYWLMDKPGRTTPQNNGADV